MNINEAQQENDSESELLRSCAFRFDGMRYVRENWNRRMFETLRDKVQSGKVFSKVADNMAAIALLEHQLSGGLGNLPTRISKEWNAARRFFLAVCGKRVPKEYLKSEESPLWRAKLSDNKRFIRSRLEASESATLENLRKWATEGKQPPGIIFDSSLYEVYEQYRDLILIRDDGDCSSLQATLLRYYRANGFPKIDLELEKARRSARSQLFSHATELILGIRSGQGGYPIEEASLRSAIIADPSDARNRTECINYLFEGIGDGGSKFLFDLANEVKNAETRRQRIKTDMHLLVLARFWVDPSCPLWLMSKSAMANACRALSTGGEWSESRVTQKLKDHSLHQFNRQPIRDVRIRCEGEDKDCEILGFDFLKTVDAYVNKA